VNRPSHLRPAPAVLPQIETPTNETGSGIRRMRVEIKKQKGRQKKRTMIENSAVSRDARNYCKGKRTTRTNGV